MLTRVPFFLFFLTFSFIIPRSVIVFDLRRLRIKYDCMKNKCTFLFTATNGAATGAGNGDGTAAGAGAGGGAGATASRACHMQRLPDAPKGHEHGSGCCLPCPSGNPAPCLLPSALISPSVSCCPQRALCLFALCVALLLLRFACICVDCSYCCSFRCCCCCCSCSFCCFVRMHVPYYF